MKRGISTSSILAFIFASLFSFSVWAAESAKININTADAPAIAEALNGVGLKKAEEIVAYRQANGPFKTVDALADVKGIGVATVEKNRELIILK